MKNANNNAKTDKALADIFGAAPSGCSYQTALAAHQNTSFVPEKRAKQVIEDTKQDMAGLWEGMKAYITPETEDAAVDAFREYVAKYQSKFSAYMRTRSRCVSWMITGRNGLNVGRVNRDNERAHRAGELFYEWREKAFESMLKRVFGVYATSGVIMSNNPDAISLLSEKLDRETAEQEQMKEINKAFKKFDKSLSLYDFFKSAGIEDHKQMQDISYNVKVFGRPYPSYSLTNINARIKSLKNRIERLENYSKLERKEITKGDVRIVQNVDIMRLQIFFPGKPDHETIKDLKSHGFRWSPSEGAWQRQDGNEANYWAKNIVDRYNDRA